MIYASNHVVYSFATPQAASTPMNRMSENALLSPRSAAMPAMSAAVTNAANMARAYVPRPLLSNWQLV